MKKLAFICVACAAVTFYACEEKKQENGGEADSAEVDAKSDHDTLKNDSVKIDNTVWGNDIALGQNDVKQTNDPTAGNNQNTDSKMNEGPLPELKIAATQYAKKLEKANSMEEVMALGEEMAVKITELQDKYPDYVPTPEEQEENYALQQRCHQAAMKAAQRFAPELKERMTK